MERIRQIVAFLLLFSALPAMAQVVGESDSIPDIPTVTDTMGINLIDIDTLTCLPVAVDSLATDTVIAEELYDPDDTRIQYAIDTLYQGPEGRNLEGFFNMLKDLMATRKGHLHIVQIGGSHIQAGTMTHRFRKHLLDEFGGEPAERGFIFPYSAASKCNNPYDYKVTAAKPFNLIRNVYNDHTFPLGASGIAVWTADTLNSITIKMRAEGYDFGADTIVLLGETRGWPIDPILKEDTVYHFPDSIDTKNGRYHFYLDYPVDEFTLFFPCSKGDTFIVNGILMRNGRPGVTLSSIGVNGAQVTSYLRCQNFARDMELLQPDMVIFNIGVNDAYGDHFDTVAFQNNYLRLADIIHLANPDCDFIFVTNNDTWKKGRKGRYYVNNTGPLVQEAMYRLADRTGGAVWDQFAVMGGLKSMETWRKKGLAQKDRVHFTATGYNLIGDLFWDAFVRELKKGTDESR